MDYSPLDTAVLSAEAQRVLGAGASRMMAARGMAPLANPVDLVSVLYQLCVEAHPKIQPAAQSSAEGLPRAILESALADPGLDPQVIDYFVSHASCRLELVETAILNRNSADQTIADLAAIASEMQVELIAQNEQRILGYSDILAAIYANPHARMSTVDRIVELAVREGITVPGIPAWDEVSRATLQLAEEPPVEGQLDAAAEDKIFLSLIPDDDPTEVDATIPTALDAEPAELKEIPLREMSIPAKMRIAMVGNKFQRKELIRDPKKLVSMAVIKSPAVKEGEALSYASNNALAEDVIAYIANKKEWTKLYTIKLALIKNPKCPLQSAMRLLPHLRAKDLAVIARSRGIPAALAAQARKLSVARSGGNKK